MLDATGLTCIVITAPANAALRDWGESSRFPAIEQPDKTLGWFAVAAPDNTLPASRTRGSGTYSWAAEAPLPVRARRLGNA